jgi:hypothetical protein
MSEVVGTLLLPASDASDSVWISQLGDLFGFHGYGPLDPAGEAFSLFNVPS